MLRAAEELTEALGLPPEETSNVLWMMYSGLLPQEAIQAATKDVEEKDKKKDGGFGTLHRLMQEQRERERGQSPKSKRTKPH